MWVSLQPRQNNLAPPRSPLLKCHGQNEDPVGRHTKAARVAAKKEDKTAKVTDNGRKEVKAKAAKDTLGEAEIDKSFIQQQEQQSHICQ